MSRDHPRRSPCTACSISSTRRCIWPPGPTPTVARGWSSSSTGWSVVPSSVRSRPSCVRPPTCGPPSPERDPPTCPADLIRRHLFDKSWLSEKARKPMTPVSKAPRKLGASSLSVFPIGLGCMSLSGVYGKSDDAEAIRVVHHAIDRGVTFLDSSDMYGWGHNETLLGKALTGGRRVKVVLATKFGQTQRPGGANGVDGRPEYVKAACEASLKRLGVEVIDLYFQHRVDPSVPIEDTVGAMADLVKAGKV